MIKIPAGYKKLPADAPGYPKKGDIVKPYQGGAIHCDWDWSQNLISELLAVYRRVEKPKRKTVKPKTTSRLITFPRLWDIVLQAQAKGTALSKRSLEEQFKRLRRAGK